MPAGFDPSEVGEGDGQSDGSMPAHSEHAHVVEENNARRAVRFMGFDKQAPDQFLRTPRFQNHGLAELIEVFLKKLQPFAQSPRSQVGTARNDDTGRFPSGVGIDEADALSVCRDCVHR